MIKYYEFHSYCEGESAYLKLEERMHEWWEMIGNILSHWVLDNQSYAVEKDIEDFPKNYKEITEEEYKRKVVEFKITASEYEEWRR